MNNKYKISNKIVKNYVLAINSISIPVTEIKKVMNNKEKNLLRNKSIYNSINKLVEAIKNIINEYPNEKGKIITSMVKQIMAVNNGFITSRLIGPLDISRQYISNLERCNDILKVSRGIYMTSNIFEDSFYSFQAKYKSVIFSHMNALYFHGMTEEFPYDFTVTVPKNYHVDNVNEKCNVFYVAADILNLGICEIKTPNGIKVRTYDLERSICDIIRSKNRMDFEQLKKTVKLYLKNKDKNISKLSEYSEKMGIKQQVMDLVGWLND